MISTAEENLENQTLNPQKSGSLFTTRNIAIVLASIVIVSTGVVSYIFLETEKVSSADSGTEKITCTAKAVENTTSSVSDALKTKTNVNNVNGKNGNLRNESTSTTTKPVSLTNIILVDKPLDQGQSSSESEKFEEEEIIKSKEGESNFRLNSQSQRAHVLIQEEMPSASSEGPFYRLDPESGILFYYANGPNDVGIPVQEEDELLIVPSTDFQNLEGYPDEISESDSDSEKAMVSGSEKEFHFEDHAPVSKEECDIKDCGSNPKTQKDVVSDPYEEFDFSYLSFEDPLQPAALESAAEEDADFYEENDLEAAIAESERLALEAAIVRSHKDLDVHDDVPGSDDDFEDTDDKDDDDYEQEALEPEIKNVEIQGERGTSSTASINKQPEASQQPRLALFAAIRQRRYDCDDASNPTPVLQHEQVSEPSIELDRQGIPAVVSNQRNALLNAISQGKALKPITETPSERPRISPTLQNELFSRIQNPQLRNAASDEKQRIKPLSQIQQGLQSITGRRSSISVNEGNSHKSFESDSESSDDETPKPSAAATVDEISNSNAQAAPQLQPRPQQTTELKKEPTRTWVRPAGQPVSREQLLASIQTSAQSRKQPKNDEPVPDENTSENTTENATKNDRTSPLLSSAAFKNFQANKQHVPEGSESDSDHNFSETD